MDKCARVSGVTRVAARRITGLPECTSVATGGSQLFPGQDPCTRETYSVFSLRTE